MTRTQPDKSDKIVVQNLKVGYDDYTVLHDVSFRVRQGDIFIIMGASGCGKSTLLSVLTGLLPARQGHVIVNGTDMIRATPTEKDTVMRNCGILYQSGALFSAMTLADNIALPMKLYTDYSDMMIRDMVRWKLALVGLAGFEDFYPAEISGGMKKRAGLARALALDPDIVYFDEPSAGLDPIASRRLDDLIGDINQSMGTTIVMVTHELSSLLHIGTNGVFLDASTKTVGAVGRPADLKRNPPNAAVAAFLTPGESHAHRTK